jgi:DNA primase
MDTSPQAQASPEQDQNARVKMLMDMLTTTLNQLVKELQTPSQPQTDLEEAVNTTLENAEWFDGRVSNYLDEKIENTDFDYEIGQNIERYFRNQFDPSDHFDIEEAVKDRVVDEVESIIDSLVEEAVEARLADLLEEKLANANITINF